MEVPESLRTRYRFESLLGEGGFGAVLGCRDLQLDRPVALKLLHQLAPSMAARFHREARVTANLSHPHIVKVYDYGVAAEGMPWIAYEQIEGRDLRGVAAPDEATLLKWARQGAHALAAVHAAGLVHRDVKPANVLVRDDTEDLVLVDLGIVRSESRVTVATAEGIILGTPAFMAPELFQGQASSPASDQYAWASTLAGLLLQRPLIPTASPAEAMALTLALDPHLAVPTSAGSPDLVATLRRGLAADPKARFEDLRTFASALNSASGSLPQSPPSEERTRVLPGPPVTSGHATPAQGALLTPRRSLRFTIGTAAFLALALGIGFSHLTAPLPLASPAPTPSGPSRDEARIRRLVAAYRAAEAESRKVDRVAREQVATEAEGMPKASQNLLLYTRPNRVRALIRALRAMGSMILKLDTWPQKERVTHAPEIYGHGDAFNRLDNELEAYRDRTILNALRFRDAMVEDQNFPNLFATVEDRHQELVVAAQALGKTLDQGLTEPSGAAQALGFVASFGGFHEDELMKETYSVTPAEFVASLQRALEVWPLPADTPYTGRMLANRTLVMALQRSRNIVPCAITEGLISRLPALALAGLRRPDALAVQLYSLHLEIRLRNLCAELRGPDAMREFKPRLRRLANDLQADAGALRPKLRSRLRKLITDIENYRIAGQGISSELLERLRTFAQAPEDEAP